MNVIYGILGFCLAWVFAIVFIVINGVIVIKIADYIMEKVYKE